MGFPKWWNKTVTVFTPFFDETAKKTVWFKYVIKNCFWGNTSQSEYKDKTLWHDNQTLCRIPKVEHYAPYKKWCFLSDAEKALCFSINTQSFVFMGDVHSDDISGLKKTCEYFGVNVFKDNSGTGHLPHYYLSGCLK